MTTEPSPRTTLPVADLSNGTTTGPATDAAPVRPSRTFYDEVGGHETFVRLVDAFYEGVADDPVMRPMYPEQDLGPARWRLTAFLEQYWGGPTTYSEQRGHPRLRMRHAPFAVDLDARDRWLAHFRAGLDSAHLTAEQDARFWDYVTHAATFMVNTPG